MDKGRKKQEAVEQETVEKHRAKSAALQEDVISFTTQGDLERFEPTEENVEALAEIQRNLFLIARDASVAACALFTKLRLMKTQIEVAKASNAKALYPNPGDSSR